MSNTAWKNEYTETVKRTLNTVIRKTNHSQSWICRNILHCREDDIQSCIKKLRRWKNGRSTPDPKSMEELIRGLKEHGFMDEASILSSTERMKKEWQHKNKLKLNNDSRSRKRAEDGWGRPLTHKEKQERIEEDRIIGYPPFLMNGEIEEVDKLYHDRKEEIMSSPYGDCYYRSLNRPYGEKLTDAPADIYMDTLEKYLSPSLNNFNLMFSSILLLNAECIPNIKESLTNERKRIGYFKTRYFNGKAQNIEGFDEYPLYDGSIIPMALASRCKKGSHRYDTRYQEILSRLCTIEMEELPYEKPKSDMIKIGPINIKTSPVTNDYEITTDVYIIPNTIARQSYHWIMVNRKVMEYRAHQHFFYSVTELEEHHYEYVNELDEIDYDLWANEEDL